VKTEGLSTFALGIAAAVVAQASGPTLARKARPVVRGLFKHAIIFGRGAQARTEGLRQDLEDLTAEAKAEARQEQQAAAASGGAGK
jgi:hypothetical protein